MYKERYFLETYIRGEELPNLRKEVSINPQEEKHLHITFVRPFSIDGNETEVKEKIVEYCKGRSPITFTMEGYDKFDDNISYIPIQSEEMQNFNSGLEQLLEKIVVFDKKLNEEKILHLTIESDIEPLSKKEMAMLRLTCIRDAKDGNGKRIWFSYDFVTQKTLNREESLDKDLWRETKKMYDCE